MEYLFLRRKKSTATSERQKAILFRVAEKEWESRFASAGGNVNAKEAGSARMGGRKIDCSIYKNILYQLEIRQVFLDMTLSLKKLSALIETNQTYVSNVVNKYFECNLKELVNSYRVEYAKELLYSGRCLLEDVPGRCGFASKSAFYAAFVKHAGESPKRYLARERKTEQLNAGLSGLKC